jgi:hypothetical protein
MGWFSRKVTVTFIDAATSEAIATAKLTPTELPETFEYETTVHVGGADWSVASAEPRTRAEYSKSGELTVRLRRVEKIGLGDVLFSLPSICDRLPAVAGKSTTVGCVMAEDDWRQLELVSRSLSVQIDAEIASIRAIHENEHASVGWRKVHVRKHPDPPIASPLTLDDIDHIFGGLLFQDVSLAGSRVVSGFSFHAGGLQCYGIEEDARVTVFGVVQELPEAPGDELACVAREFDLDLIHWCRCERASWDEPLLRQLLTRR